MDHGHAAEGMGEAMSGVVDLVVIPCTVYIALVIGFSLIDRRLRRHWRESTTNRPSDDATG